MTSTWRALFLLFLLPWAIASRAADKRPNVIVILADDLGAEGLGCYGSSIYHTPNLDRMAGEGMRFNNAYATPLCTPTRVMLMSGLYPNRTGFQALISKEEDVRLPSNIETFGHYFREAGYQTAIAGKWQLGQFDEFPGQPLEHGFDHYCLWTWMYQGKKTSRYYSPQIYRDGKVVNGDDKDFGPDIYSEYLLNFIAENKERPFFVYYPMALVHAPFVEPPGLDKRADSKSQTGLDKNTATFGRMITYMDQIVGKFLARLKELGLEKDTLLLFTGDNGIDKKITSRISGMSLKGGKGTMTEAGTRVPLLAWWPESIEPGVREDFFCLVDVLPTILSVAGIKPHRDFDGLDLSHTFFGTVGPEREQVLINLGKGYFVRDRQFRLNQDGTFYNIPITSDPERYSEKAMSDPGLISNREELESALKNFRAIESEFKTGKRSKARKK